MSYISEVQAKKMICDAAKGIRLCVATTVNGVALTSNDTFYDLLVAINGLSGGTGTFSALTGDVTSTATGGNTIIGTNKVTNAKAAQMSALTIKGNNTGATANQADLTVNQVQSMLADNVSGAASNGTSSGYSTTEYVTAAVTRTLPTATSNDVGRTITYKAIGANITIAAGTNTIDGASTSITINSGDSVTFAVKAANTVERVYALITTSSSSSLMRVRQNGADIKYVVVSGSPTVTFTKSGGTGTVATTGGIIDVQRVQVDFNTTSDTDGANDFAVVVPTTQSGTMLQYPNVLAVNTQNGSTPSTVAHLYKNPASTPVFSVIAGTAGTSITVKIAGTNVLGSTGTIILNF